MADDRRLEELEDELKELRVEFRRYVEKKQVEESQRLKAALVAAGTVIIALGSFIWMEVVWPVIKGLK